MPVSWRVEDYLGNGDFDDSFDGGAKRKSFQTCMSEKWRAKTKAGKNKYPNYATWLKASTVNRSSCLKTKKAKKPVSRRSRAPSSSKLTSMLLPQLKKLATQMKVQGRSKMNKGELLNALLSYE